MEYFYIAMVMGLLICTLCLTTTCFTMAKSAYRSFFPNTALLRHQYPTVLEKQGRRNFYQFTSERPRHWVALKNISPSAVAAILVSEDGNFYRHEGYEPELIRKAWEENRRLGRYKRGASTITQQVVKNLFLSPEKTISRKVRELLLAVELERQFSKKKILETYLNIAEWGHGIYGIEAASRFYFKKSASSLTVKEGAILAFLLPNPTGYQHTVLHAVLHGELSAFGSGRVSNILQKLWRTGQISDAEYASDWIESTLPSTL